MSLKKVFLILTLCTTPFLARATFVEKDWNGQIGAATLDESTNLLWIDLTQTTGLTHNDVASELGASGIYAGFDFASETQIRTLLNEWFQIPNEDFSDPDPSTIHVKKLTFSASDPLVNTTQAFVETFGITCPLAFCRGEKTLAFYRPDELTDDRLAEISISVFTVLGSAEISLSEQGTVNVITDDNFTGHFLVSAIPAPPAFWLFISSIAGLMGFRQRQAIAG